MRTSVIHGARWETCVALIRVLERYREMKPPFDSVDVDGVTVRVKWVPSLGRFPQGYSKAGDYGDNQITIITSQTRRAQRGALMHELIHHCIERIGGMPTGLGKAQSEEAVCEIDSLLACIMLDNPKVVKWLSSIA